MELHPRNSHTVYHEPIPGTIAPSAAEARDVLAEHVLDPRSGTCRVCLVPSPCEPADFAITALTRLGVSLPGTSELIPVNGPTLVLSTVPPRHLAAALEHPTGPPSHHAAPAPPGVDPLDWALAVRLLWDHRPDESEMCRACGTLYWCRARHLVQRVINGRRPSSRPSEPADRLRLTAPGHRTRRAPGDAGRDYFATPPHRGAPGRWGKAAA
ncbi:hypothetical protein Lfu02_62210 [Longispora fulva]|nr:hypothetical protein Lfu02_62210 [Longispora fulva]